MSLMRLFNAKKPLIGMVHLGPLPGSPLYNGEWGKTLKKAVTDAKTISEGGMQGCIIENYNDMPYYPRDVPPVTVSAMTEAGRLIKDEVNIPIGINVLRNDAVASLAIAYAIGAKFIRINVFVGARLTDQGIIEGSAWKIQREKKQYMQDLSILADVGVKHSTPIGTSEIENEAMDADNRGFADGLIISGDETGKSASLEDINKIKKAAPKKPIYVGSGLNGENAKELLKVADGAIVGTSIKKGGITHNPVSLQRVLDIVSRSL